VDVTALVSAKEFEGWQGVDLVHLPSGNPQDYRQAHPSLSASLPVARR
jgi:hypothetical protein